MLFSLFKMSLLQVSQHVNGDNMTWLYIRYPQLEMRWNCIPSLQRLCRNCMAIHQAKWHGTMMSFILATWKTSSDSYRVRCELGGNENFYRWSILKLYLWIINPHPSQGNKSTTLSIMTKSAVVTIPCIYVHILWEYIKYGDPWTAWLVKSTLVQLSLLSHATHFSPILEL